MAAIAPRTTRCMQEMNMTDGNINGNQNGNINTHTMSASLEAAIREIRLIRRYPTEMSLKCEGRILRRLASGDYMRLIKILDDVEQGIRTL